MGPEIGGQFRHTNPVCPPPPPPAPGFRSTGHYAVAQKLQPEPQSEDGS